MAWFQGRLDSEDGFCTGCRMSVASNSPSQDSSHPDDHFHPGYITPGFKPFSYSYTRSTVSCKHLELSLIRVFVNIKRAFSALT